MVPAQLTVEGLWKVKKSPTAQTEGEGTVVLQDIHAKIFAGDRLMVIGPSGSGKSTLLRMLNRLEEPTRGRILLDGVPYTELDVFSLRRQVGMVMQVPALFPGTVAENILYGPKLLGTLEKPEEKVNSLLKMVGLAADLSSRRVENLSVGQQQRVSFARTLANKPKILVLDEPTSALDPAATSQIEQLIMQLNKELGITVIMVTHSVGQAQRIGTRAFFINGGKKTAEGEMPDFFEHPPLEVQAFLESAGGVVQSDG